MQAFTAKYSDKIQGVLSGFDRLIFRGSLRKIAYTFGLNSYLWANHVLLKDFGSHANEISDRIKEAALRLRTGMRTADSIPAIQQGRQRTNRAVHRTTGPHHRRPGLRPHLRGAVYGI